MRISPSIDTDPNRIESVFPQTGPIVDPFPPTTQSDISGILQREQDHVIALLSSSPLFARLFLSYVNQATALEPASATPSPESEEWKVLQNAIATLREEIEKLKSEGLELTKELESSKAFRSQVSSLEAANTTQQDDIKSLRAELAEAKENHDRLMVDCNAEKVALQIRILDLEVQQGELKEAIVEQQIKISNLERQCPSSFPDLSTAAAHTKAACTQGQEVADPDALMKEREEFGGKLQEKPVEEWIERMTRRQAEQEAGERAGHEVREQTEKEAKEQAEKAVREQAEREAKRRAAEAARVRLAEVKAQLKPTDEGKEWEEREEKGRVEREAKEKPPVSKTPSAWVRDHRGVWIQGGTVPPRRPSGWGSSLGSYLFK